MHIFKFGIHFSILLVLAGCFESPSDRPEKEAGSSAQAFEIAREGRALVPIVLPVEPTPRNREAAEQLADAIRKISGAEVEIVEGPPTAIPEHAIWVGYQPVLKELFPNLDFEFQFPEEILISANKNHLVIAGRDVWDPKNQDREARGGKIISGVQQEYGTANAVYTFLQKFLGVRWFWPGELGEDIVMNPTISFEPFEYRYHPQIRARAGIFNYSKLGGGLYGRSGDWVRFQRLQLDSLGIEAGHPFVDWFERFYKEHPEYFALQPDGSRSGFPSPRYAKLCASTPAVWDQWLKEVEEQLKKNPYQTVFGASENDGYGSGHCVCEGCSAWDSPDAEMRKLIWKEGQKEHVALSDRQLTFANILAGKLREKYPDKDYYVLMGSYGFSRPAPMKTVPDKNVIVMSVANFLNRHGLKDDNSPNGVTFKQQYEDWSKLDTQMIWRPNMGSPVGGQQGQPDISLKQTAEDFRFVAEHNCVGIFIDMIFEHWATQGPQYYLMAQLAWDPMQDANKIMDDYYSRAFGKASEEMREYWTLLDDTRANFANATINVVNATKTDMASYYEKYYTPEVLDLADELLQKAMAKVSGEPELYRKRIEFVRAGLEHTRLMVDLRSSMSRYIKSEKKDEESKQKALANWQAIEKLCEDNPYAVNWLAIRPITPRMVGLHPDHLVKTKGKKKLKDEETMKKLEAEKKDAEGDEGLE